MKQAGYKTYWITNQQTMTKRNTMLTTFSEQTDEQVYLNSNRNQNARQYDGDVIEPFNKILDDPAPDTQLGLFQYQELAIQPFFADSHLGPEPL
jgi:glucan phosphoethanolaminetransferase (alkaline phosphatase superfamily)